jgi:HEPN domain-containing protein
MASFSPIPEQIEVAELLAEKAAGDLLVAKKLAPYPDIDDDAIGFHTQQAVEKALKVGLTLRGTDYPKTHDIDFLLALLGESELSDELMDAGWLTPWGAKFRYDDAPLDTLNRNRAIAIAETAVTWCQDLITEVAPKPGADGGDDNPPPPPPPVPGLGRPETLGGSRGKGE